MRTKNDINLTVARAVNLQYNSQYIISYIKNVLSTLYHAIIYKLNKNWKVIVKNFEHS